MISQIVRIVSAIIPFKYERILELSVLEFFQAGGMIAEALQDGYYRHKRMSIDLFIRSKQIVVDEEK